MPDVVSISVVMPVYNEVKTIGEVIERVLDCGYEAEVIVVDDASTDGTREYLKQLEHPRVHCLYHAVNRGKGAALRLGFAAVRNPYVIVQDADLEYDPKDYRHVLEPDQRPQPDGHGNRDEGVSPRQAGGAHTERRPLHVRAGNNLQGGARAVAYLRSANLVLGTHV